MKRWLTQYKLNSKSSQKRLEAIRQLRESNDPGGVELLVNALADSEVSVRAEAAGALGALKDISAVKPLIEALKDPAEIVQEAAIQALQRIRDPLAVDALAGVLLRGTPGVQWRAARALKAMDWIPRRTEEEIQFFVSTGNWKRVSIFGAEAIPAIANVLRFGSYEQRVAAVTALGEIGDPSALKSLLGALKDEDALVRSAAVNSLARTGNIQSVPSIMAMLKDRDDKVRAAAAAALGELGDPQAVSVLIAVLNDSNWEVRSGALQSLGRLGDERAKDATVALLRDQEQEVRQQAAETLGKVGDVTVVDKLVRAMMDEHVGVRQAAARSLTMIEPYWERTDYAQALLPEIEAAVKHRDVGVQYAASGLLRRITGRSGAERTATPASETELIRKAGPLAGILQELLRDADDDVRLAAVESLGRLRLPATTSALRAAMNDSSDWVRRAAQQALSGMDA